MTNPLLDRCLKEQIVCAQRFRAGGPDAEMRG